jgi:phosphoglucosamine mutase
VLIGKDTRISGYMLEAALEAGFSAAGCRRLPGRADADAGGGLPDPRAAPAGRDRHFCFAQPLLRQRHQVLFGAGHQAAGRCRARPGSRRASISRSSAQSPNSAGRRIDDARGRYIEFCKSTFPNDLDLRGLKIVVDCAHGAAYHIAPQRLP